MRQGTYQVRATAGCLLLMAMWFCAGCRDEKVGATNSSASQTPMSGAAVPMAPRYSLSNQAKEVAGLLDRRGYTAADTLCTSYLRSSPADAGLYCQYVRLLIEAYDAAAPGYITNPLITDDKYWVTTVAIRAVQTASELDPSCKPYLTDLILRALHANLMDRQGEGFIARDAVLFLGDRWETSMIQLAWNALELDKQTASQWVQPYRALQETYVRGGKVASAFMMGNLCGDLQDYRGKRHEDFRQATVAFSQALDHDQPTGDLDWAAETYKHYKELFAEVEPARLDAEAQRTYQDLLAKLNRVSANAKAASSQQAAGR